MLKVSFCIRVLHLWSPLFMVLDLKIVVCCCLFVLVSHAVFEICFRCLFPLVLFLHMEACVSNCPLLVFHKMQTNLVCSFQSTFCSETKCSKMLYTAVLKLLYTQGSGATDVPSNRTFRVQYTLAHNAKVHVGTLWHVAANFVQPFVRGSFLFHFSLWRKQICRMTQDMCHGHKS